MRGNKRKTKKYDVFCYGLDRLLSKKATIEAIGLEQAKNKGQTFAKAMGLQFSHIKEV